LLIGEDRNDNKRTLNFYKGGIKGDKNKLENLVQGEYDRYILAFVYPGCSKEDMQNKVDNSFFKDKGVEIHEIGKGKANLLMFKVVKK
jgi:hypothetical protein